VEKATIARRAGRPVISKNKRKTNQITVWVSDEVKNEIAEDAESLGLSLSSYFLFLHRKEHSNG